MVRGVDYDPVWRPCLFGHRGEDPVENAAARPADIPVIERFVWTIDRRGITPAQAVAYCMDDPAQNAAVIDPLATARARKVVRKALALLSGKPELVLRTDSSVQTRIRRPEPGQGFVGPEPTC